MTIGPVYILHFVQTNPDFRLPEFDAVAQYLGVPYELQATPARGVDAPEVGDVSRPFMLCRLPSDDAARKLLQRCSCLRGVWQLWATGDTYAEIHEKNRQEQPYAPYTGKETTWKALIQSFNVRISDSRRLDIINDFSYMPFEGPIRMKKSDLTWGILEEYSRSVDCTEEDVPLRDELGDKDPRLVQLFFGRKIKDRSGVVPARDLIDVLSLKKRSYIGNTSMESEMSIIMANMAHAGPSSFVYDPFAGTGSMLYACSIFGAMSFGSDIDGRMLRGREADGPTGIARSAKQYGLQGRILDCAVFDTTHSPWRAPFRTSSGGGIFDAIVTDPPYGIRAGAKRLGRRDVSQQRDEPHIMPDGRLAHTMPDYIPPTRPYRLSELVDDLMRYASALLRPGGRLVFWLPTMTEDNAETTIPTHPHFELVAHSLQDFGKWGRRLITMKKLEHTSSVEDIPTIADGSQEPGRVRANDDPTEFRNRLFAPRDAAAPAPADS
ncbi:tRNA (guanine(10)-N(2))-methyltransferase [Malassezia cuniculi]|uniref:tRNA (guanine(10)-N(2))-methyltransferase n=1 Tax=Malassezia cuniculi TaxID=948313 RepID=A0AAF0ENF8_9BASI|nr:tRNA (guanine(10)-N(2))-methyltransferase [Malassezia cuniculi]